jgi:replicative DNA helicase
LKRDLKEKNCWIKNARPLKNIRKEVFILINYEELKQQINILTLAEEITGIKPKKTGVNTYRLNPCPICNGMDHFTLYSHKNSFSSFNNCCTGGDVINFIKQVEKLDHKAAVKRLEEFAEVTPVAARKGKVKTAPTPAALESDFTDLINTLALNETDYYSSRGLSDKIINEYKLGYHPQGLNGVIVENMNFDSTILEKTSKKMYCYQYILPIWNANGTCSYFISRLNETAAAEKELEVKPKTHNLTGYNTRLFNDRYLVKGFTSEKIIFVTEGIFDALSYETIGYKAIALNSVQNKNKLVALLKQNKDHLKDKIFILIGDNDKAGQDLLTIKSDIESLNLSVFAGEVQSEYKDSNEHLQSDLEGFKQLTERMVKKVTTNNEHRVANYIDSFFNQLSTIKDKTYIPTGFKKLDNFLKGGLYSGLYVLGAISSLGKTTQVLQIADYIAEQGTDVLFFSLEMSKMEIVSKSVSRNTALLGDTKKIRTLREVMNGEVEPEILFQAFDRYRHTADNLYIIEGGFDMTVIDIEKEVEKHIRLTGKKPVVIVDYLQILTPIKPNMTEKQANDYNVKALKIMSRNNDIPVIAISSFNRSSYTTPVSFAAFKETGAIEYTADVVIGLQVKGANDNITQDQIDQMKAQEKREIELVVLKNRNGISYGKINFDYIPKCNLFIEM